jgi:hypothetical protein
MYRWVTAASRAGRCRATRVIVPSPGSYRSAYADRTPEASSWILKAAVAQNASSP